MTLNFSWKLLVKLMALAFLIIFVLQVVYVAFVNQAIVTNIAGLVLCICTLAIIEAVERKP